ncbi:MAG: hypothetical protein K0R39_3818 [Symbiobacteriaceae bacterium]|jgi:hypothetical protein|nr:hypothetical protein [Symbiobacteriaceae bacterium]
MLERLLGPRVTVAVRVIGVVGDRVVHWAGQVHLRGTPDLLRVLRAAGKEAGADLIGAIAAGAQPAILLSGERLDLPADLARPIRHGAQITWLMPMAGG